METQKLITALESAAEGSEYLDYSIQRQFGLMKPVPPYTRSIDAAMSLVPDGWSIHRLMRRNDCRGNFTGWQVELYRAKDVVLEVPSTAACATAALTIACAALQLRRAADDGSGAPQQAAEIGAEPVSSHL
jgi:hypothetical protein